MDNTKESDYMEIFTELIKFHYPEIEISEKSNSFIISAIY